MLVQLSDPHVVAPGALLLGRIDTPALLARCVAAVNALQPVPEAVLVTGDLVDLASEQEYLHLRTLLAPLRVPALLMPGNHDDIATLRRVFHDHDELRPVGDPALDGHVLWARHVGALRVVALDTVVPRAPHGRLCSARLDWLERMLAEMPQAPTIVAMHHPPFATGIGHMDAMGLVEGAAALEALLRRHGQVARVACGHLHRPIVRRFGAAIAMTVPSTAHQIVLDLDEGAPAAYRREPPGFAIHQWREGDVVSHFAAVGDFGPIELYD